MPTQNVDLSEQQAEYVRAHVADGRSQDASEVVRAGLRLLEESEAAIRFRAERFKKLAEDGFDAIDRGEFEVITESSLDGFMQSVSAVNRRTAAK
jgi:antitoxin ParD1/3/4